MAPPHTLNYAWYQLYSRLNFMPNITHVSLSSGTRDILIGETRWMTPGCSSCVNITTTEMRNVGQTIDHNSILYDKRFYDVIAPTVFTTLIFNEEN